MNALQKQDYQVAEEGFKKAVEFRHKYFPNESAGDDLQELMKIANHRKDQKAGLKYAKQILAEPNVAPIHKGRALFRLSQFAFNKNNKELYDSIYNELMALKASDGISPIEPVVEVNHEILNGNYEEAVRLCEQLSPDKKAERLALIYHRMGNDQKLQGLGLSICKSITDLLGGKIWLDDSYNLGTRFIFELPKQ